MARGFNGDDSVVRQLVRAQQPLGGYRGDRSVSFGEFSQGLKRTLPEPLRVNQVVDSFGMANHGGTWKLVGQEPDTTGMVDMNMGQQNHVESVHTQFGQSGKEMGDLPMPAPHR